MQWSVDRLLLVVVAVILAAVLATAVPPLVSTPLDRQPGEDTTFVRLGESDTTIWPYTASKRSFGHPTAAVNVVVENDPDRVKRYMIVSSDSEWNVTDDEWEEAGENRTQPQAFNATDVAWQDSYGAERYLYARPATTSESGQWYEQAFQLHHGDYFGHQHHVRAFDVPVRARDGPEGPQTQNWTVMQAHTEHWDWFTLTHTVDSLRQARTQVEADFMGATVTRDVRREYFANGNDHDADGWATVVRLVGVTPPAALALLSTAYPRAVRRRLETVDTAYNRGRVGLFVSVLAVVLGIRLAGIAFERYLPTIAPNTVVAILYPILVLGVPLCAYAFGQRLSRVDGALFGGVGMGTAIVLDYAALGIGVLPIEIVVHRAVVVTAVSLLAAGAIPVTEEFGWNRPLVAGISLWIAAITLVHLS